MNHSTLPVLLSAALAAAPAKAQGAPPGASPDLQQVGAAIEALAADLWGRLAGADGNVAFSPASIALALSMTTAGARGQTQQELLHFLHVDDAALLPAFGAFGRKLATDGKVRLAIANRLFGDQSFPFEQPFLDLLAQGFGARLETLDIRGDPERARLHVNEWVAVQTGKKVRDLLPPASVNDDTRLLLANAVHFLGDWWAPFPAARTAPQPFHRAHGTAVDVPTMNQTGSFGFAEVEGQVIVQLCYKDKDYAMLFVLPRAGAAPATWLTKGVLALPANLPQQELHLFLPRFRVEALETTRLASVMRELGVKLAFTAGSADLTGIANPADARHRLYIDNVYHKAFVRVDEKGTEAAAATVAVVGDRGALPAPSREVRFDRPFWFALRHLPTGAVLFAGKVTDPR